MTVTSNDSNRRFVIVALCLSGFVLVLLSQQLGPLLVRHHDSPSSWSWRPDEAYHAADTVRCLGVMLLATGLAERLAYALRSLQQDKIEP